MFFSLHEDPLPVLSTGDIPSSQKQKRGPARFVRFYVKVGISTNYKKAVWFLNNNKNHQHAKQTNNDIKRSQPWYSNEQ